MPAAENEAWAKADLARLITGAATGDVLAAAFLYAPNGDPTDAAVAQTVVRKVWQEGALVRAATKRLNGDLFKGGQVGIPETYYDG